MAKQKVTAIQFSMIAIDEDEKPIIKHGFRAYVAPGTSEVAASEQMATAARAAVRAILNDYEIGEVRI